MSTKKFLKFWINKNSITEGLGATPDPFSIFISVCLCEDGSYAKGCGDSVEYKESCAVPHLFL